MPTCRCDTNRPSIRPRIFAVPSSSCARNRAPSGSATGTWTPGVSPYDCVSRSEQSFEEGRQWFLMTRLHLAVKGVAALSVALCAFGLGAGALAADAPAPVLVGHIQGEINPITARYVDRVVSDGEADNAAAGVFVIDTPGGLIDATYQTTARFLATRIPIVTFVAPTGARAASAGTFITMAGNIAAM